MRTPIHFHHTSSSISSASTKQAANQILRHRLDGAIAIRHGNKPDRAFCFDVTFVLDHPNIMKLASDRPLHFHPYQKEYVEVIEGKIGVGVEGKERILTPDDGELIIQPSEIHRVYPLIPEPGTNDLNTTRLYLSGEDTVDTFKLDTVFFQNFYGYLDSVMMEEQKMDIIQLMNMLDAGGTYLSFPSWVPFNRVFAQLTGIVVGRWLGSLLGYQPFHRKWTSDWQTACEKMETSIFTKRFAGRTKHE